MRQRAAVLGSPIEHSLSPALHRAAYRVLGLDWDYRAIECTAEQFEDFFAGLGAEWRGLSLTMPLKEVAVDVVAEVCDVARLLHSANTIYRTSASEPWQATNTDVYGMEQALIDAGVRSVGRCHVLGAGATARSAIAALARLQAREVVIHARRRQAAEEVVALAERLGVRARAADLTPVDLAGDRAGDLTADLLVSTLPADAAAPWAEIGAEIGAPSTMALLDASYHPWPTPLAAAWSRQRPDAPVASGKDMLLWQALEQVRLMTGQDGDFDDAAVLQAMRGALG